VALVVTEKRRSLGACPCSYQARQRPALWPFADKDREVGDCVNRACPVVSEIENKMENFIPVIFSRTRLIYK
jgi:hypothetical protein